LLVCCSIVTRNEDIDRLKEDAARYRIHIEQLKKQLEEAQSVCVWGKQRKLQISRYNWNFEQEIQNLIENNTALAGHANMKQKIQMHYKVNFDLFQQYQQS
jgi:hypothetical protein